MALASKRFARGPFAALLPAALALSCAPGGEGGGAAARGGLGSFEAFRAATYREPWPGGAYIVEGDLPLFGDDALRAYYERLGDGRGALALVVDTDRGRPRVWGDGARERFDISYCIERGSFAEGERKTAAEKVDEILRALRTAAARWEAVADVRFRHAEAEDDSCGPANGDVDFNVREVAANDKYSASAFFPGDPREESELKVARDAFDLQGSVVDDVMTHELGHVLGFRHEHVRREAPHEGGAGCYDESSEGLIALTPHDRLSVMTYPECLGDPQTQYLISPADEDGALALYGSPGRLQPGGAVPVAWRRVVEGVGASLEPVGRALRARRGTTFVAVLRGQPIVDLPNLFVNVGAPAAVGASTCQPALENDAPEVCRVTIAADRDEDVYIAVSSGDAARSTSFGLYVAYVPASGG